MAMPPEQRHRLREELTAIAQAVNATLDASQAIAAIRQMKDASIVFLSDMQRSIWSARLGDKELARLEVSLTGYHKDMRILMSYKVFRSFRKRKDGTFNLTDAVERLAEAFHTGVGDHHEAAHRSCPAVLRAPCLADGTTVEGRLRPGVGNAL